MAEVKTHGAGGKAKLHELIGKKALPAGHQCESASRECELVRNAHGDRHAEHYTSIADDASMSEAKREASMLLSAAEGSLEVGDVPACLKVAERALKKFSALENAGRDGVADSLHVIIDAHRLEAYVEYKDPERAVGRARLELERFRAAGDRRGEATMQLALAEMSSDDVRLVRRQDALDSVTTALAIARELEDKQLEAKCLIELAFVHFTLNHARSVLEVAEEALAISEALGDNLGKGMALYAMGLSHARMRSWEPAVERATMAQRLFESLGKKGLQAGVLHTMAVWWLLDERPKRAVPLAERALTLCREVTTEKRAARAEAVVTFTLCEALVQMKYIKGATKVAGAALERFEVGGHKRERAIVQEALTLAHLAVGATEKAARTIEAARLAAEELDEARYESRLLVTCAAVHARAKEREEAVVALQRAAELAKQERDLPQVFRARCEVAAVNLRLEDGDLDEALGAASEALSMAQQDGDKLAEAAATLQVALCHAMLEERPQALAACYEAEEMCREVGHLEGAAKALWLTAELKALDGKLQEALEAAEERLSICRQLHDVKMEARALALVADLNCRDRRYDQAEHCCKEAVALAQSSEDANAEMDAQVLLVQVYIDMSQSVRDSSAVMRTALKVVNEAVATATRLGEKGSRGVALYWKAQVFLLEERFQEAQRTVSEAEALFRDIQSEQGQGACLHLAGILHALFGQADKSLSTLERALAYAQACKDAALEAEVATSIYNIQRQSSNQELMADKRQPQQSMMPTQDMGEVLQGGGVSSVMAAQPKGLDPTFVRRQLLTFVKEVVAEEEAIELDSPFMEAGMDSLSSVSLMSMVAKEFQMALSPSLVFDFPTVRSLEDHLVEESKAM